MPTAIKILPPDLIGKIAAGEVVQRPASVVKELIENSIDAGATNITTIIRDAGKSLVQVVDDGIGMSEEDAILAFERHATSKIETLDDLEDIRTLGFRGEALASIAAVSQVELKTKLPGMDVGTLVKLDGGELKEVTKTAMESGTSLMVKNLFYNTPARKHFMKSNATEFKHIYEAIQRLAIARPEIGFRFVSEEEPILDLRPSELEERLTTLFGEKPVKALLPLGEEGEVYRLSGYLGKPEFARKVPSEQFLYLNKRFIVNRNLNHAVYSGYEHLIEKGSYPFVLLFLQIDPRRVDVNVHPTKLEVKFEDERGVYRFVMMAVRRALSSHNLFPGIAIEGEAAGEGERLRFERAGFPTAARVGVLHQLGSSGAEMQAKLVGNVGSELETVETLKREMKGRVSSPFRPMSQIQNKYILLEIDSGIMLVDQHAAHERVLYERVLPRLEGEAEKSQQLLFPQTIELSLAEFVTVNELAPLLEKIGFQIKIFGKQTIVVEGVPPDVKPGQEASIFSEVLDEFRDDARNPSSEIRDRVARSFACRAAIKAGDKLSVQEMGALMEQLFKTEVPSVCPHGRPVSIKLSIEELDKRFGRT